jgi:calpain
MIDFTGGINETYDLSEAPANLFNIMKKALKGKSLIGTSIVKSEEMNEYFDEKGLVNGHAYSITKVKAIPLDGKLVQLVKVRNPWGNDKEWNGKFSDESRIWKSIDDETKAEIGYANKKNGEFFMKFEEFKENFTDMDICHISPEGFCNDSLEEYNKCFKSMELSKQYSSKWIVDIDYNPQIIFKLENGMIVALSQKNRRNIKTSSHSPIEINIYKLSPEQAKGPALDASFFKNNRPQKKNSGKRVLRDICEHYILKPGYYAIIPRAALNESGDFFIRIYTQKWFNKKKHVSHNKIFERKEHWKIHEDSGDECE